MNIINETYEWVRAARGTYEPNIDLQIQQLELIKAQQAQEIDEIIHWLKEGNRENVIADVCDNHFYGLNMLPILNISPIEYLAKYEAVIKSNWTKYCKTEGEAIESVEAYANGTHPAKFGVKLKVTYLKRGDYYVLFFLGNDDQKEYTDWKIAKSINFVKEDKV